MHSVSYFSNYVFSAAPAFAYASKILGGRRAETKKLGTATSLLTLRSPSTEQTTWVSSRVVTAAVCPM